MENKPLTELLAEETEKVKISIADIVQKYLHKTGLQIWKIEMDRKNISTSCGTKNVITDIVLFTEQ